MLKRLELDVETHRELLRHSHECGIQFLSTGFDRESIELLDQLGLPLFKIPSGEITNYPLIQQIGSLGKPVIVSTGMCDLDDIRDCLEVLTTAGRSDTEITVLHCNTQYPTPMVDVNLRAMKTIQSAFPDVNVGYSDHTLGIEVPIAAVAMGATTIEKHFTLDRTLPGPDHAASLEPVELKQMVDAIRNIELALGDSIKQPT